MIGNGGWVWRWLVFGLVVWSDLHFGWVLVGSEGGWIFVGWLLGLDQRGWVCYMRYWVFVGWFLGSGCWVFWVEAAVAELWWLRFVGCGLCWAVVGFVGLFYLGVQLCKVGVVGLFCLLIFITLVKDELMK